MVTTKRPNLSGRRCNGRDGRKEEKDDQQRAENARRSIRVGCAVDNLDDWKARSIGPNDLLDIDDAEATVSSVVANAASRTRSRSPECDHHGDSQDAVEHSRPHHSSW